MEQSKIIDTLETYHYAVLPINIFVEYVGTNMSIQVLLLVIDQRRVSVMSTLFSNP